MAVAGKVAITPRGNWDANTSYQKLDFVFYNDSSYTALKPSKGIAPTNTEYWMLSLQGVSRTEIDAILDGTIQVGDAETLDGHGVDDFALSDHVHTASQVGLGKVNNTSDSEKPVSTAQAAAIDAAKSAANTYTDTKIAELEDSMADNAAITELQETVNQNKSDLASHTGSTSNPHGVTKSQVGLGNVPNVATNDQTPTYTVASADAELTSGEKLSSAFAKIAKAIKSLIAHIADTTKHITSSERISWNSKANGTHNHTKSEITDFPSSMPASDVPSWAKASSKPTYKWSEITEKPTAFTPASHTHTAADVGALATAGGTVNGNLTVKTTRDFGSPYGTGSFTPIEIDGHRMKLFGSLLTFQASNPVGAAELSSSAVNTTFSGTNFSVSSSNIWFTNVPKVGGNPMPTMETGTFNLTIGTATISGFKYTKIGSLVYLYGQKSWSVATAEFTAPQVVTGLPFAFQSAPDMFFFFGPKPGHFTNSPDLSTGNNYAYMTPSNGATQFTLKPGTKLSQGQPLNIHAIYLTD